MATCYILIKSKPGMETKVFQKLKKMSGIKDSHILFGDFDIITKIESRDFDKIAENVIEKIRKIEGVLETKTFPCTEF
jgi:DNA-binding Lrp family transcriptional regulator